LFVGFAVGLFVGLLDPSIVGFVVGICVCVVGGVLSFTSTNTDGAGVGLEVEESGLSLLGGVVLPTGGDDGLFVTATGFFVGCFVGRLVGLGVLRLMLGD
jgi:hypothetical protein